MPKTSIPANENRVASLTRRGLLGGTVAALVSPLPPPTLSRNPDAELAALDRRFTDALAAYAAAERHRNVCETRFLNEGPDPPAALTRDGPLGKLLAHDWSLWCAQDLEWLLEDRAQRKHWHAARAVLAIADAYEAEVVRFEVACGLAAAEAAQAAADNRLGDLTQAILAAPARSFAGLVVKARVVKEWGRPEWWSDDPNHSDATERLVAEVLDAVIRKDTETGA